ncbi:cation diffusion facilitator family transporter [Ornithinimicrobium humiphilum]|uniref:Cobalt-zinc-cadmium efflux system protein n=1 Tax=Ornithinimicrobium humiphilum TaxID=125288 RepID=A0A543KKM5_9MICO|nr:cation diffusion facilitator family transporter [Ornithinimicrobium humiphilum]TQM95638.1 cobalt-zinc-cadmium efflux system protein [Ornithinimicrobium humiphilum]
MAERSHPGHPHAHAVEVGQHRGRLAVVLAVTVGVLVAELVGAALTGSLALLADAGHMLTDVAGLATALVAAHLATRPATSSRTWGFRRAEVLGAALQAAVLLVVGVLILVEGVRRLVAPPEVPSGLLLLFGVVGLVGNLVGLALLAGARGSNLNLRAAFLEVLADALGSVAVIVAAVVMATTGWWRADALASLLIGALIVPRTVALLRETVHVLMESTPRGLDLDRVRQRILGVPHVTDVHDLHATLVATGLPVLTAHVVVEESCFHDGHLASLLDELQGCLSDDFDVTHSTIQFEAAGHADHEHPTHA